MPTALSTTPITSRWYGQGRAVELARRLESLTALSPPTGPAAVITARPDDVTVTFVDGLTAPLPPPWQPAGREARITWDAVATDRPPDPDHPVFLVVFGTTGDGALIGLNLAAFSRIRITGDHPTVNAVIARWVLELLATHPAISIGLTRDAWTGPWTTRVRQVAPGNVPDVDVLVCGAELTYADRAQIVAATTSPILLDLGDDAAITTTWSITCSSEHVGQIRRGATATPMAAKLIVPAAEAVERCTHLMVSESTVHDTGPAPVAERDEPPSAADAGQVIDFFDDPDAATYGDQAQTTPHEERQTCWPTDEPDETPGALDEACTGAAPPIAAPPDPGPAPQTDRTAAAGGAAPAVAPIWNRILGRITLAPPHPGAQPGPRERRLNELLIYLQLHRWAGTDDIIGAVFGGAATDKTVTQQMSLLRARLGVVYPGGPKALPPMNEGTYSLAPVVCSDWMEFDRLVEILIETTATAHLIAAMELISGPPLGGITGKEWPCARDLREQIRDRVPGAAAVLARRHYDAGRFAIAVEVARKGLWYDAVRQDLWEIALSSALEGRDKEAFRALRSQFLNTIPGPERDRAVVDLTGRAG